MACLSAVPLLCSNSASGRCKNRGKSACGNCHLVVYCSKVCQQEDWSLHRAACKGPLSKSTWRPAWDREDRIAAWALPAAARNASNVFGGSKYLWGNVPAIDVLQLGRNEGDSYRENLALLFAASGDLRNVVQTVGHLPNPYVSKIDMTINDMDFEVVARNAMLLLFVLSSLDEAYTTDDIDVASVAEALIHLWYSASVTAELDCSFRSRVLSFVVGVCDKTKSEMSHATVGETWTFACGCTMRLVLRKEQWIQLSQYFEVPRSISQEVAYGIRTATTLAPERVDYRDRWYYKDMTPSTRVAKQRFREDGLLLPFGHPRNGFDVPNPTLFRSKEAWPMDDKSDPMNGWPILEVLGSYSPAKEDQYGKLFAYLRSKFSLFLQRLSSHDLHFEFCCTNATELPRLVSNNSYDRVEVANISDSGYLGVDTTVTKLAPLLRQPRSNPSATLITLFLNAVTEVIHRRGEKDAIPHLKLLMDHLPTPSISSLLSPNSADSLRLWDARSFALDVDEYFHGYTMMYEFGPLAARLGVELKRENSIVEPWPTRVKRKQGGAWSQHEFNIFLGSDFSGLERYTEWRRIS